MENGFDIKEKVIHSLKWVTLGKILSQIVRWIITFWVIRLLTPDDYGLVALSDVVFSFLTLLAGTLFGPAIIQAKSLSTIQLKNIFGSILISFSFLFIIQYAVSDYVAIIYQDSSIADILKVNAWCFLLMAFRQIPMSTLLREMEFKKTSITAAISNSIAAVLTLLMAYMGWGFWSLIYGEIIAIALSTLMLIYINPVRFWPSFDFKVTKEFITFGGAMSIIAMLAYIFLHMDIAIAGIKLSSYEIGLFAVALQIALMPQKKILPLLKEVAFPAYSRIQENRRLANQYFLKSQRMCILMTIPIFWGIASVIDIFIPLVLGDKWQPSVLPSILILCIMPLRFSEELFNPFLKSQRKLKHQLVNFVIIISIMFVSIMIGVQFGYVGLAMSWTVGFPLAYLIIISRNMRVLELKQNEVYIKYIYPVLSGVVMILSVFVIKYLLPEQTITSMIVQIITGAVSYITMIYILDRNSLKEVKLLLRKS